MRSRRVTFIGLLQAAAVITIVFSVVTSFDFAHRNIELFSHFRLQYLVASLALLAVFAVLRKPVYSVPLFIITVLNASYVLPWYLDKAPAEGKTIIKILNANVHSSNNEYRDLFDLVGEEQPDVIFLQEFSPAWRDATQSLKNDYPFNYAEPREGNFGIAMFSRIPLDSVTHIDSPPLGYPTIIATVTVNEESLTLIDTHPMIPITRSQYDARNEQLDSLVELTGRATGAVALIGDLNISIWCRRYRMLEERTGLRNARRGFGIVPTWPTFVPFAMIPIDHALVSDDIGVVEIRTGRRIGSDHLPLVITITI